MDASPQPRQERSALTPSVAFPLVGIGASAGGLEALSQLLAAVPPESELALLVVQHLDPNHKSRLPQLLSLATTMPVVEATDGEPIEPRRVYVMPPNANLGVTDGRIRLTPRDQSPRHFPVDYLFRSLAAEDGRRAIAVVLSGSGTDGTQGCSEIKAAAGITLAQDEETATHPAMPKSAVDSGCIDFILPPAEIGRRLGHIATHPWVRPGDDAREGEATAAESYHLVLNAIRGRTGVDFALYRDTTIRRRIMRRMALHAEPSMDRYAERLSDDRAELDALYHDLLINVTSFFRDPELFDVLKSRVFPELARTKAPNDPIRVWVPGCSTGQEAYSIAMALIEFYDNQAVRPAIQIFATDLSEQTALDKARAGVYPVTIETEVTPERLQRFFRREDNHYRIDQAVRDCCVFARHNLIADPPFSHIDMISCRNVLIYLSSPLQRRILPTFHYALNVPGFLVLGVAETIGDSADLFDQVDRTYRIFSRRNGVVSHPFSPSSLSQLVTSQHQQRSPTSAPAAHDFQREADRILLGRFSPPGVLVDENFDILQFRGRTNAYLESPAGDPTNNVLKMAREGLFLDLRNALTEASKQNIPVSRAGISLRRDSGLVEIGLEVLPVLLSGAACFLVLFHEGRKNPPREQMQASPLSEADSAREQVQVRQELVATREYLQSMIEQQDAANEELRSANEEILSSNEELQSTNEELETAKEELQSANEELSTLNEQLQRRNLELDLVNSDLTNLLDSADIPVVMVAGDRRIRRLSPPARSALGLLPTDVGRPIGDMRPAVIVPDLERIIGDVVEKMQTFEREVRDRDGRWHLLRVHPYRTADNRIDGAVVVLVDIDQMRRDQEKLVRQSTLIELSQDAVVTRDAEDRILSWNRGAEAIYGWTAAEAVGQRISELLRTNAEQWASLNHALQRSDVWDGELTQTRKDGTPILIHCREVLIRDESGRRVAVLAIKRDITQLRRTMEDLREADRRKNEFLATLAHELRNPLAPIRNAIEIMRIASANREAIAQSREILDRQATQLARIVEDLVDLARIVEKKIEVRKEQVAVASVVQMALDSTRPLFESNQHELNVELPEEPIYLHADPVRIAQVLVNLLNNASKYTDPGGRITISAERSMTRDRVDSKNTKASRKTAKIRPATEGSDSGEVVIRVSDTGRGISPTLLPHVFEMFTQGPRTTAQGRGGLGVGLALVKSLVEMHGGTVAAISEGIGKGSEFVVRLPADKRRVLRTPRKPEDESTSSRRILVVDDNDDQVASLSTLLEVMGHRVEVASTGEEAIAKASEFRPDLMLVDIGLPGIAGYEVARRIREDPDLQDVVLVAQTGWGSDEDRRRSKEAGFDRHLVKPVSRGTLQEILSMLPT